MSPPRVACPLLPNVPEVPPPPTPKPWQQNVAQNQAFAVTSSGPRLGWTGPARCPSEPASPVKESTCKTSLLDSFSFVALITYSL